MLDGMARERHHQASMMEWRARAQQPGRGKNRKSAFTPLFTETWRQTLIQLDQHEKLKQTLELAR